jgi:hypothetical protein
MSNEWYNREREYKEGCYINGRGYYNEDTNRWATMGISALYYFLYRFTNIKMDWYYSLQSILSNHFI